MTLWGMWKGGDGGSWGVKKETARGDIGAGSKSKPYLSSLLGTESYGSLSSFPSLTER